MEQTKIFAAFRGVRGRLIDLAALVGCSCGSAVWSSSSDGFDEIDTNPLLVSRNGWSPSTQGSSSTPPTSGTGFTACRPPLSDAVCVDVRHGRCNRSHGPSDPSGGQPLLSVSGTLSERASPSDVSASTGRRVAHERLTRLCFPTTIGDGSRARNARVRYRSSGDRGSGSVDEVT
jgi:hypothetical protein